MSTLETQYREYLRNSRGGFCSFEQWKEIHANQIKQALIQMMQDDEELGLYDESKQETLEDFIKSIFPSPSGAKIRGIELGAEWQAKRMYSEEEVENLLKLILNKQYDCGEMFDVVSSYDIKKVFNQFKNK